MLFFSYDFILLFLVVVVLYFTISKKWRWCLLLAASYFFYGFHHPGYVLLLLVSTAVDYWAGIKIHAGRGDKRRRWMLLSICLNLGLLGFFKYYNFFGEELSLLANYFGFDFVLPRHSLALPIGLSFYTFQTISYVVDIYRGYLKPERHLGKFALYVCFFPQLLAGPIEKARRLIPQFHFNYDFQYDRVVSGMRLILWGLFKKMIIADRLAKYVNEVFASGSDYNGTVVAIASFLFWLQLLYDFGAYCDIAVGTARIFGINLSRNFYNHIYLSSYTEFWKQWHITLTQWFRSYVFFTLVQFWKNRSFWYLSIFITFALTGLWHGARWTFLLWGAVNGLLLIFEYVTANQRQMMYDRMWISRIPYLQKTIGMIAFLGIGVVLSALFRSESIGHFFQIYGRMSHWSGWEWEVDIARADQLAMFVLLLFSEIFNVLMGKNTFDVFCGRLHRPVRWMIYCVFIYSLVALQVIGDEFIYFEF